MGDFILGRRIDPDIVTGLLDYFVEKQNTGGPGIVIKDGCDQVEKSIKDSWDILVPRRDHYDQRISSYITALLGVIEAYKSEYPHCTEDQAMWGLAEDFNLQRYEPGGGFKVFHYEKAGKTGQDLKRHLVFMTFLNTIAQDDGGGTEFLYQKRILQADADMTWIWPAEWTHTHRGVVSPNCEKIIATGWFSYL